MIQATLHPGTHLRGQDLRLTASRARLEKSARTIGPVSFDPAFERQWFNLEGACEVGLAHRAVDVELADDHAEGVKVVNRVGKDRHCAAVVDHRFLLFLVADIVRNRVHAVGEDGQLHLWHA